MSLAENTNRFRGQMTLSANRLGAMQQQLVTARQDALRLSPSAGHDQRVQVLSAPALLRGRIAYMQLLQSHLSKIVTNPPTAQVLMSKAGEQTRMAEVQALDAQAEAIALETLSRVRSSFAARNRSELADDIELIDNDISMLKSGRGGSIVNSLLYAGGLDDEDVSAKQR